MKNVPKFNIESYAHIINADRSILKLNPAIEKFGYRFECITASELERNYSDMLNVSPNHARPLTIIIGREKHGISHELNNAMIHHPNFSVDFFHSEYPEIILLKKIDTFVQLADVIKSYLEEWKELEMFCSYVNDLLLQLRLYKFGEIRVAQYFQMEAENRNVTMRRHQLSGSSRGKYVLNDAEALDLSTKLKAKCETNSLTDLAVKNFNIVYDIPDGRIRFITLMTCLESLFNVGKDQIAHTISSHMALILSDDRDKFKENYKKIKNLYNKRNSIVHGGEYKGDLAEDYLELADKVRLAIAYCNKEALNKELLFEDLNAMGY